MRVIPDATRSQARLLSAAEAAAFLGLAPHTLAIWRSSKRYNLPYFRVGRSIRYCESDLEAFLAARRSEVS